MKPNARSAGKNLPKRQPLKSSLRGTRDEINLLTSPSRTEINHAQTVLVCGDRNWTDEEAIRRELSRFPAGTKVIHGAARGADELAALIAKKLGFETKAFPANWRKYGKAAGPIRNQRMLEEHPDIVLAFHRDLSKSKGTADTVKRARAAGVKVRIIQGDKT